MELLINYWPLWVFGAVLLAAIALVRLYSSPSRLPYEARGKLVTKSELRFYKSL